MKIFQKFYIQTALTAVLLSISVLSYGQTSVVPDWFGGKHDTTQWPIVFAEQSPSAPTAEKQILFIYSKASSAYDQAFTTITTAFKRHRINAGYTLINYQLLPERTETLLASSHYDLAFIAGSSATSALYRQLPDPAMPVVTVTAKDPVLLGLVKNYQARESTEQTGHQHAKYALTSLNIRAESLVSYLQTLNPDLRAIGILYGENNHSALKTQAQPLAASARSSGIAVQTVAINADNTEASLEKQLPAMLERLKVHDKSQKNTLLWLTGSTLLFQHLEHMDRLAGQIPLLSAVPDLVSSNPASPMMSIGTSFSSNAALAAVYGRQILNGSVTPSQLPVGELSPPDIAIHFQKVRESGWKIPVRMFELATILYNDNGQLVQQRGMQIEQSRY